MLKLSTTGGLGWQAPHWNSSAAPNPIEKMETEMANLQREMKLIEDSFVYADRYLRQRNGFLLNATRGGRLEVLERVDFEEAIKF